MTTEALPPEELKRRLFMEISCFDVSLLPTLTRRKFRELVEQKWHCSLKAHKEVIRQAIIDFKIENGYPLSTVPYRSNSGTFINVITKERAYICIYIYIYMNICKSLKNNKQTKKKKKKRNNLVDDSVSIPPSKKMKKMQPRASQPSVEKKDMEAVKNQSEDTLTVLRCISTSTASNRCPSQHVETKELVPYSKSAYPEVKENRVTTIEDNTIPEKTASKTSENNDNQIKALVKVKPNELANAQVAEKKRVDTHVQSNGADHSIHDTNNRSNDEHLPVFTDNNLLHDFYSNVEKEAHQLQIKHVNEISFPFHIQIYIYIYVYVYLCVYVCI
ncbi:hypothetical protein RFI_16089 [Reticulomyxa filosa]|uniref:Uncharacterized protein n=1 Tax=Reticulomyxa filosa TaxID=46433 RepID=X6N5T3_RETFI|nr:hypothetical protein RFI_16089 [Reticulomyxa filosa]|eukprot:ETO21114.1 hypothetical protein RFI_16089 [Reticulomyxa filosa]